MHLRSLPTMERISVPVRRHPEHYFVVQRSVRLIAIILYQGYNTLKQGLFHIKAVTALLRESHTLNKAVTAVFTSKAAARYKAVIVLRHTTALLRDPYCKRLCLVFKADDRSLVVLVDWVDFEVDERTCEPLKVIFEAARNCSQRSCGSCVWLVLLLRASRTNLVFNCDILNFLAFSLYQACCSNLFVQRALGVL